MGFLRTKHKNGKSYYQEYNVNRDGKEIYIRSWKSRQDYIDAQTKDFVKAVKEYPGLDIKIQQPKQRKHYGSFDIKDAGDIELRCNELEPNSVDAIITDPPYPKEFLPLYDKLGKVAKRVLRPGGSLVVMVGQSYLIEILNMLSQHLAYQWAVSYLTPGGQSAQMWQRKVNTFWKPVLWFVKDVYDGKWIGDVAKSAVNANEKDLHEWQQSESGMFDLVDRFTKRKDVVLDPFMGSGTTGYASVMLGRNFIGIDISNDSVNTARERLARLATNV